VEEIVIKSSWIVGGHGDVVEVGARLANGKKMKPHKKRGKPITPAARLAQQAKIAAARERRRHGVGRDITPGT